MSVIWHPVSRIVRAYLIEQSVGLAYGETADWPIATTAIPDKPPNVVTVFDEAAQKKTRTLNPGTDGGVIEDPVVSIHVRSHKPDPGLYKAKQIQDAMDRMNFWTWVGDSDEYSQTVVFANARRTRGIFNLGMDENSRWVYNLEYALVVQSVTGA